MSLLSIPVFLIMIECDDYDIARIGPIFLLEKFFFPIFKAASVHLQIPKIADSVVCLVHFPWCSCISNDLAYS